MESVGPPVSDTIAGEMILSTPTINTSIVKSEERHENHLPLFSQRRQKERRQFVDLRGLFTKVVPMIHHQDEQLQVHEQEGEEGNAGDKRTLPPMVHHPNGFIAAKITSASKLGPRPLLTTLIISQSRGGDWVKGGAMASHAKTQNR